MKKDHCTGFPETWVRWKTWYSWELFKLSKCCKKHDGDEEYKGCHSTDFAKCLITERCVLGCPIFIIASLACLIKYTKTTVGKW